MNKKLFKIPILFALILCMCFVFVGCGQQAISSKDTPPEGVSQEVYDSTLELIQEAGEYLKKGDYTEADKVLIAYEKEHPVSTGRVGERVTGEDKQLVLLATSLIEKCVFYSDREHYDYERSGFNEVRDEEEILIETQKITNKLKRGYTIDIQEDHKIIIEEIKK